jgi:hypothetical protein
MLSEQNGTSRAKGTRIGQPGPIPWPPRSPDLTPWDFYLSGYVKEQVYHSLMPQYLREQISWAIANVDESQLWHACEESEYCFDFCRVTNGAHVKRVSGKLFHAVFGLFHVCIYNRSKNTLISYHPNHL